MRNKSGLVCITLGVLLLLGAAGLSAYNVVDDRRAGENAGKAYEQLRTLAIAPGELELPEFILPEYEIDPRVEMPEIEIDGNRYIGFISAPRVGLELPVMSEWSYPNMKTAPCRYWGSVYLNNMVICAHNYVDHFRKLSTGAVVGDLVVFTDVNGNVFNYTISEMLLLNPDQTWNMVKGTDWDLTLFTCTTTGRQRTTIRCVRVEDGAV